MRILLTNDDGYLSLGIRALESALGRDHEVWIVAPDRERSGCSHSITSFDPVITRETEDRVYACSGVPVDCINLALGGDLMPEKPDVVISGINHGPNFGTDVLFSGTAAGARQAVLSGIPAVALSIFSYESPFHFEPVAEFVRVNLQKIIDQSTSRRFLNFNFPNTPELPEEVRLSSPALIRYKGKPHRFQSPRGEHYHFSVGSLVKEDPEPGTDLAVVLDGAIAVTPVGVLPPVEGELDPAVFTS